MKLIDADALLRALAEMWYDSPISVTGISVSQLIDKQPSIDIVRCKECKHSEYREDFDDYECHSSGCGLVYDADFFCADGEVRDE